MAGDGTSDKIVSVASGNVDEDEGQVRDLVDPQTPYTSCLFSTGQVSARQKQKEVRTTKLRLRSDGRVVGFAPERNFMGRFFAQAAITGL